MVFYFKSNIVDPPAFIYVGKDKVESTTTRFSQPAHPMLTPPEMRIS